MYKALTVIALPVLNEEGVPTGESVRKEPGAEITPEEMKSAGQSAEEIEALLDSGAISEDMEAELHPDHRPVPPGTLSVAGLVEQAQGIVERMGEDAPAEIQALAKLDATDVTPAADSGKAGDKGV